VILFVKKELNIFATDLSSLPWLKTISVQDTVQFFPLLFGVILDVVDDLSIEMTRCFVGDSVITFTDLASQL